MALYVDKLIVKRTFEKDKVRRAFETQKNPGMSGGFTGNYHSPVVDIHQ